MPAQNFVTCKGYKRKPPKGHNTEYNTLREAATEEKRTKLLRGRQVLVCRNQEL